MKKDMEEHKGFPDFGYRVILFLLSIPASMIIGRWLPQIIIPINDGFDIHHFVSFFIALIILQFVLFPFRKILSFFGAIGIVVLVILLYREDISNDDIVDFLKYAQSEVTNNTFDGKSINYQSEIEEAIRDNFGVKEYVSKLKNKYHKFSCFDQSILTCFELFDNISCKWNYQNDPKYRELFRPSSETILTLTGDCDDHAICLATCMNMTGARSRIIHTEGHLYPELFIGKSIEREMLIDCLILIYPQLADKNIYFTDEKGELWLNMDYSSNTPGSKNLGQYRYETYELRQLEN